jgi:hypothetical protein
MESTLIPRKNTDYVRDANYGKLQWIIRYALILCLSADQILLLSAHF